MERDIERGDRERDRRKGSARTHRAHKHRSRSSSSSSCCACLLRCPRTVATATLHSTRYTARKIVPLLVWLVLSAGFIALFMAGMLAWRYWQSGSHSTGGSGGGVGAHGGGGGIFNVGLNPADGMGVDRFVSSKFDPAGFEKKARSIAAAAGTVSSLGPAADYADDDDDALYDDEAEDDDETKERALEGMIRPTWVWPMWRTPTIPGVEKMSWNGDGVVRLPASSNAASSSSSSSIGHTFAPADLSAFTFFVPAATPNLIMLQQHAMFSWSALIPPHLIHVYVADAEHCALVSAVHTHIRCRVSACVRTKLVDMSEHDREEAAEAAEKAGQDADSGGKDDDWLSGPVSNNDAPATNATATPPRARMLSVTAPLVRCFFSEALGHGDNVHSTTQSSNAAAAGGATLASSASPSLIGIEGGISTPYAAFINDHILLFPDFLSAVSAGVRTLGDGFAMVGRTKAMAINVDERLTRTQWHEDITQAVEFDTSAEQGVLDKVSTHAVPLGPSNILGGVGGVGEHDDDDDSGSGSSSKEKKKGSGEHQHGHSESAPDHADSCHILNYFVFPTAKLSLHRLPADTLLGGLDSHSHRWESWLLASIMFAGEDELHPLQRMGVGADGKRCSEMQVIDASAAVRAIEPLHHQRSNDTAAIHAHNLPLFTESPWLSKALLGKISNSDFHFEGRCPRCVLRENHGAELSVMLQRQVTPLPEYIQTIAREIEARTRKQAEEKKSTSPSSSSSTTAKSRSKNGDSKISMAGVNPGFHGHASLAPPSPTDQTVIVLTINADYLPLAYNFLCRASELGLSRFVFLAEDRASYRVLLRMGVSVVIKKFAPFRKAAANFDTMEFQEMLYFRSLFFHQLLSMGYNLLYTHLDTVWFENPLQYMQNQTCHMFLQQQKLRRISGGIMFVRANQIGSMFAKQYVLCEAKSWSFYVEHGRSRWSLSDDRGAECVDYVITRLSRSQKGKFHKCLLDSNLFPDSSTFFDHEYPQRVGLFPAVVHLNVLQGLVNKTSLMVGWGLWRTTHAKMYEEDANMYSDGVETQQLALIGDGSSSSSSSDESQRKRQAEHVKQVLRNTEEAIARSLGGASISLSTPMHVPCKAVLPLLPPPSKSASHFTLSIALLCSFELADVRALLKQLDQAVYPPTDEIHLSIFVDYPASSSSHSAAGGNAAAAALGDDELERMHFELVRYVRAFAWTHGKKKILVRRAHVGRETQWVQSWLFATGLDNELHLVLEPFVRLSPLYYEYIKQVATTYYFADTDKKTHAGASGGAASHSAEHGEGGASYFDPRLMGFSLAHTTLIVGETPAERYGSRVPRFVLEEYTSTDFVPPIPSKNPQFLPLPSSAPRHLYLYQLPPLVAPVFFPRPWQAFVGWYENKAKVKAAREGKGKEGAAGGSGVGGTMAGAAPSASSMMGAAASSNPVGVAAANAGRLIGEEVLLTPCIPTLISNRWWQEAPDAHWWVWLARFVFERGVYFMHSNYAAPTVPSGGNEPTTAPSPSAGSSSKGYPLALAIDARGGVSRRHIILHTSRDPATLIPLLLFSTPSAMLTFDFHFNYIPRDKIHTLERRHTLFPPEKWNSLAEEGIVGGAGGGAGGANANQQEAAQPSAALTPAQASAIALANQQRGVISDEDDEDASATDGESTDEESLRLYHAHARLRRARDMRVRRAFATMNLATLSSGLESRCFVIGDDRLYTGPINALIAHDEDLVSVPLRVLYERTYLYNIQKLEKSDPGDIPKFIVFAPKSDFTFDHGLRGLYFSFILALALKRILLVDWPEFEKSYQPPLQHMQWSLHYPRFHTMYGKGTKSMTRADNAEQFRLNNLFSTFTGQFLINNDRVTADRSLFQNLMYFSHLPPLYFGSHSRMRRTGMVMQFLLSKPTQFLLNKVAAIAAHTGIDAAKHLVAVHVPVPTSWLGRLPRPGESPKYGDPANWGVLPGVVAKHWSCIKSFLYTHNFEPNNTVILFTTNRAVPGVLAKAEEELGAFGRVVNWEERPPPRTYVADAAAHAERQRAIDNYIDPAIVNGWLLAEAAVSISAGTTYGIFNAARTNFRRPAYIIKVGGGVKILDGAYWPVADGAEYCGHMQRMDKAIDQDIEF